MPNAFGVIEQQKLKFVYENNRAKIMRVYRIFIKERHIMANVQKKRVEKKHTELSDSINAGSKCISFGGMPLIKKEETKETSLEQSVSTELLESDDALETGKEVDQQDDVESSPAFEVAISSDTVLSDDSDASDANKDGENNNACEISEPYSEHVCRAQQTEQIQQEVHKETDQQIQQVEEEKSKSQETPQEQQAFQKEQAPQEQQTQHGELSEQEQLVIQESQTPQEQQTMQGELPEQEQQDTQDTASIGDPDDDIAAEEFLATSKINEHVCQQRKPRCEFSLEDNNIDGNPGTISELHDKQKDFFKLGTTVKADWRKTALGRLHSLIDKYETPLIEAIHRDLGITRYEAYLTELAPVHAEFKILRKNIEKFCASSKMGVEKDLLPTSYVECWQPHGTVCIINSWESPVAMAVILLAEAIAAGNTVVLKNSGRTKRCNEVLAAAFDELFKSDYVRFIFGGADMDAVLLSTRFNKFCYVGPRKNAAIVYEASANACAPTMLLNSNNACFVDSTANVKSAAEKIMWGKMIHSGQTRYTPHYALVSGAVYKTFINRTFGYIEHTYGSDPIHSKGYPRMFSRAEFDQACELLDGIGSKAQIVYGGERDLETLRIAPTVVLCDSIDNPLFKRPITGPILVVGTFGRAEEAFEQINQLPTPAAFYMFSSDKDTQEFAMRNAQFGQGCINDCMMQIINRKGSHSATGASGVGTIGAMRGLEEFGIRRIMAVSGEGSSLKSWRKTPFPLEGYDKIKKVFKFFTSQK